MQMARMYAAKDGRLHSPSESDRGGGMQKPECCDEQQERDVSVMDTMRRTDADEWEQECRRHGGRADGRIPDILRTGADGERSG